MDIDFGDIPQKKEKGVARRNGLVILLIVFLLAVLAVPSVLLPAASGGDVRLGFVSEPGAYNAYELSRSLGPNYTVSVFDGYEKIINGLNGGTLDAALLAARYMDGLDDDTISIAAVTSYLNLVILENGGAVHSVFDLDGRQAVAPESLQGTPEHQMLSTLLSGAGVTLSVAYADDEAVRQTVSDKSFDILLLRADQYAAVRAHSENGRVCFDLADQWTGLTGSLPPAGSCLVVRRDVMHEKPAGIKGLMGKLKQSIDFVKTSQKKAAAAVAAGGADEAFDVIWKTIPHCRFEYADGEAMTETLERLQTLRSGAAVTVTPPA